MPYGESLATGPVGQPAIYNPNAELAKTLDNVWSTFGVLSNILETRL